MADLTLADAWKIEKEYQPWADDKGTSVFVIRSAKGQELVKQCGKKIVSRKSDYAFWSRMNPSLVMKTQMGAGRKLLFDDFEKMPQSEFWKKYGKVALKRKVRYMAKKVAKITGIETALRKRM